MALSNGHIQKYCKPGKGAETCKYLILGAEGFECGKINIIMKIFIDKRPDMTAEGDNCKGYKGCG